MHIPNEYRVSTFIPARGFFFASGTRCGGNWLTAPDHPVGLLAFVSVSDSSVMQTAAGQRYSPRAQSLRDLAPSLLRFLDRRDDVLAGGDPRTVGAERHTVHIGLRGVRLRRVRGAASGMTSSLTWTCLDGCSPKTGTALLRARADAAAMSHHIKEVRHKRKKGMK